jgi:hypothetical protein
MFRSLDKESKKEVLVTTFLFLTSKSHIRGESGPAAAAGAPAGRGGLRGPEAGRLPHLQK